MQVRGTFPQLYEGHMKKSHGQAKVHTVMGEFKRGALHSGSARGPKVTSRKQAVAIAMSEAGMSKPRRGSGQFHTKDGGSAGWSVKRKPARPKNASSLAERRAAARRRAGRG